MLLERQTIEVLSCVTTPRQKLDLLEVRLHSEALEQERRPVSSQEVSAAHFNSQTMHFQLLSQEGLFVEVVPPDEDEGSAMP